MPALIKSNHTARITFLGLNPDREASLRNVALAHVKVGFGGFEGESRGGVTRASCSRVGDLYPRGTQIRNTRQVAIVSVEELAVIAANMGVDALDPTLLSTGMVVEGIPDFSHIPPGSRLIAENGTALVIDVQNRPCVLPGPVIEAEMPGKGAAFKPAAKGLRGVTAWVERPGTFAVGDTLALFVPDQRGWRP